MQLSAFRNMNVKLIMPVIIQEEKWSVPTAIARIVLVNGLEYELRAIGQAKVWLESLEEGTCYEGEIPASCVKKMTSKIGSSQVSLRQKWRTRNSL